MNIMYKLIDIRINFKKANKQIFLTIITNDSYGLILFGYVIAKINFLKLFKNVINQILIICQ
jgi:hypothetical protein